jgi:[ribosomal protein S5]-alanine N-acetyltransferase
VARLLEIISQFSLGLITADEMLETERLVLEPLLPKHAPILFERLKNATLYQYIPQEPPADIEALLDRFNNFRNRISPNGLELWLNWALRLKQSSEYIGLVQATINQDQSALIAYFIFSAWQKRGFCREALFRLNKFLFDESHVTSVFAEIDTRNLASIKVVEGLGFERIDTVKNADFFKGNFSSEYRYRLEKS